MLSDLDVCVGNQKRVRDVKQFLREFLQTEGSEYLSIVAPQDDGRELRRSPEDATGQEAELFFLNAGDRLIRFFRSSKTRPEQPEFDDSHPQPFSHNGKREQEA